MVGECESVSRLVSTHADPIQHTLAGIQTHILPSFPTKEATNIPNAHHDTPSPSKRQHVTLTHALRSGALQLSLSDRSRGGWTMSRAIIIHACTYSRRRASGLYGFRARAAAHIMPSERHVACRPLGTPSKRHTPRSFPRHNAILPLSPMSRRGD